MDTLYDDEAIIKGLQQNDEAIIRHCFVIYKNMVFSFVLKNNGNELDAEELLQDVILKLCGRVSKEPFHLSSKLITFVGGITKNLWLKELAKRKNKIKLTEFHLGGQHKEPIVDDQDDMPLSALVLDALELLEEGCKRIIKLSYVEKKSHAMIAEELGLATNYIKVKLFRCIEKFREKVVTTPLYRQIYGKHE